MHSSLAGAIRLFHTAWDGDVLDAVSTNRVASKVSRIMLGLTAAEMAWEAVLSAVAT